MELEVIKNISQEINVSESKIKTVLEMLQNGATVPFIARYRKEVTGGLNEEEIREIEKTYKYENNLKTRKEEIIRLIDEKGMLTEELKLEILKAKKLQVIEDLYLPYKEKKKTKATEAIKNGLEPLADYIASFDYSLNNIQNEAEKYINENVETLDKAIEGACFIIAERIADKANYRKLLRNEMKKNAVIETKSKKDVEEKDPLKKYEMYYSFSQKLVSVPAYRTLAFNRAEKEKVLNVKIDFDATDSLHKILLFEMTKKNDEIKEMYVKIIEDAYKRLIFPALEREFRKELTEDAHTHAISLFAENLEELLMQPPLKNKWILGVDPAFRTGCKLAVINENSDMIEIDVIYPHPKANKETETEELHKKANKKIQEILSKYPIEHIVVGNGTASRETEKFLKANISDIPITIVSEAGASVYSASKLAKEEFPNLQVEQRSAVSIARRMQDPMAELVKIDPKSIGVGQYQHDVNQKQLAENLDFVMIKNINKVGVDVNTASAELLKYVSGLDKTTAKNIVEYRSEIGGFKNRKELLKVKRLGAKAYEQCAGFLKIMTGDNEYDRLFIHPENYKLADQILKDLKVKKELVGTPELINKVNEIQFEDYIKQYKNQEIVALEILKTFENPYEGEREELKIVEFDAEISSITDLKEGMRVKGQVRNIVDFGAFVDIGIKNDALIHISQISNTFVKNITDHLNITDVMDFKVKSIDEEKGKVQLTLKEE